MYYTLQKQDVKNSKLEELLNSQQNSNVEIPIATVSKNVANNISAFCTGLKIHVAYNNGLNVGEIELLNGLVKPIHNRKVGNIIQQFNIRSSYVATIEKQLADGIITFYHQMKEVQKQYQTEPQIPQDQTLFFDASHESNLQRVLAVSPAPTISTPNTVIESAIQELSTIPVETPNNTIDREQPIQENYNNIVKFDEVNQSIIATTPDAPKAKTLTLQNPKKNGFRKLAGYINVVMLGTIAAALLIFASILIGVKIMNMS